MDKLGADFEYSLSTLHERLQANAVAMQVPIGSEENFRGIVDIVHKKAYLYQNDLGTEIEEIEIPEEYQDKADQYYETLVESLADVDESIMEAYLEGEEIPEDKLKAAIRKATVEVKMFPVFCGTAFKNKGVQLLLDGVVDYLQSPLEVPPIIGVEHGTYAEIEHHADDNEKFAALAFKVMTDPFVGRLTFFRVYSGTLESGSYVLNATKDKRERVGRILQMHANHRQEIEEVF